jgi:hypothetical protein
MDVRVRVLALQRRLQTLHEREVLRVVAEKPAAHARIVKLGFATPQSDQEIAAGGIGAKSFVQSKQLRQGMSQMSLGRVSRDGSVPRGSPRQCRLYSVCVGISGIAANDVVGQ